MQHAFGPILGTPRLEMLLTLACKHASIRRNLLAPDVACALLHLPADLPVSLPVQLSTRKKDMMAFSGLVYEDDAVCHLSLASVAHPRNVCWCKASVKSCQAHWLICEACTLQPPLEEWCLQQDRSKYSERLGKWKLDDINKFMDLLDVPRGSGDKADTCADA